MRLVWRWNMYLVSSIDLSARMVGDSMDRGVLQVRDDNYVQSIVTGTVRRD